MNTKELEKLIAKCLEDFYKRRLEKLESLKLNDYLRRKNPYLYKAIGTEKASEIVEEILTAYLTASDEGIFGDAFFEPIAKIVSCGVVSPSEGVDVAIETDKRYLAVAVKSGPNIYNSSQKKRQNDEFNALRSRLLKLHKQFDALLGHCYGRRRSEASSKMAYRENSGQVFWEEITGVTDFYLKLIRLMKDVPSKHRPIYKNAWAKAINRFTAEFIRDFCNKDGSIDWGKMVAFNSGTERTKI